MRLLRALRWRWRTPFTPDEVFWLFDHLSWDDRIKLWQMYGRWGHRSLCLYMVTVSLLFGTAFVGTCWQLIREYMNGS